MEVFSGVMRTRRNRTERRIRLRTLERKRKEGDVERDRLRGKWTA